MNAKEATEKLEGNINSDEEDSQTVGEPNSPLKRAYLLEEVHCRSFRGIAPAGEDVTFSFDGKSNLIYGPNGSGKTSLLGAVIWALTGTAVSDSNEHSETAPIHAIEKSNKKGKKIADWAVVATLPDEEITKETQQECFVKVKLVTEDRQHELHLRRCISNGLEWSLDEDDWKECDDLTQFGIDSLDLQLSLIAPTIFGHFTVEDAPDTKRLLSLMLGYDDLEIIGELASKTARNRTLLNKQELEGIKTEWQELREELQELPDKPDLTEEAKEILIELGREPNPTVDQIDSVRKEVSDILSESEKHLAKLVGLDLGNKEEESSYAEILAVAISVLEQDLWTIFPELGALDLEKNYPVSDEETSSEKFRASCGKFKEFVIKVKKRIKKRLEWWHTESKPESKATLLIRAAEYYDPELEICPVCEQTIEALPVKSELSQLKSHDKELKKEVDIFFRELCDELDQIIPKSVSNLAEVLPKERLLNDWQVVTKTRLSPILSPIVEKYDSQIKALSNQLEISAPPQIQLVPENADEEFNEHAKEFIQSVEKVSTAIAILEWSSSSHATTKSRIQSIITSDSDDCPDSLYNKISVGKASVKEIKPLEEIRKILKCVHKTRFELTKNEASAALLNELETPLNTLKKLKKYAESEVNSIFEQIQAKTIEIWETMYPDSSTGLSPAKLAIEKGRNKNVTAFLSKSNAYEVPGQYFGNAGLQRSVALAFYFALLEKHPNVLGFTIMDDPILSLDDSHRESWTRKILKPWMCKKQFIVATHQAHYLNNCKGQFIDGVVVELNPRLRENRLTCRPGKRLDKAEEEIERAYKNAPTEMRKYREDVLATLDAYSAVPFFDRGNLKDTLNRYKKFSKPNPLASDAQLTIIKVLSDESVTTVLDPGSHAPTEADVTLAMVKDCHRKLRKCESKIEKEIERLERIRLHSQKVSAISSSLILFDNLPDQSNWGAPVSLEVIGKAAAKGELWEVDVSEDASAIAQIDAGDAILVASDTLDPVAKLGQWVLLAPDDGCFKDGDLVAACCANNGEKETNRFLRRIWSNETSWVLQSINPVEPIADIVVPKNDSAPRKIIGVLYAPTQVPYSHGGSALFSEWITHTKFKLKDLSELKTISVEGKSLEPIARAGQKVLVEEDSSQNFKNGDLIVLKTDIAGIGNVIKRIYKSDETVILVSPNPVDSHPPLLLTKQQLQQSEFWLVRGVLFESIS